MLKNISRLEHKIGERLYHLTCDMDSPLLDVKEAVFQFLKYIGQCEDSVKSQEEAKKVEDPKIEEAKIEELTQPHATVD